MIPSDPRPDPDALLRLAESEERRGVRGRLKVFLGASPGVGKTFAMLEYAQTQRRTGADVVVGVVETHGRAETAALLQGLECLPRRAVEHRGARLEEFDLDGALARRPALLLVDELAHTNAPGARHAKRWQDVEELLDAGISVCTALNIQHLESLNDVVAQITGVTVRETVPDAVLERADEVELVDVSPEVLEERLREGRVYVPDQAARALGGFFRRGNLVALRELALRRTAERVDADLHGYRAGHGIAAPWPATERVLVAVAPTPDAMSLVRHGARLARRLRAPWLAVYVETPDRTQLNAERRERALAALHLAGTLGAETLTVPGLREADELTAIAARRNATLLVVGTPSAAGWWELRQARQRLQALARAGRGFTLHVVPTDAERAAQRLAGRRPAPLDWRSYGESFGWVAAAAGLGLLLDPWLSTTDIAMLMLLAVALAAVRVASRPAIAGAVAAILAFDFCFVPPRFTLAIADESYLLTFGVFLAVAVGVVRAVARLRQQGLASREREARTAALYGLGRRLTAARRREEIAAALAEETADTAEADVVVWLPQQDGSLAAAALAREGAALAGDAKEATVARWVCEHGQPAGLGTPTLGAAQAVHLPLAAPGGTFGVLALRPAEPDRWREPEAARLLEAAAGLAGSALERVELARARQRAQVQVEAEQLRTSLLSTLSHDLRTPLAGITGAASALLETEADPATRRELAGGILDETRRLTRLVGNLLEMVKVESDTLQVAREWQPIEEVVGAVLLRLDLVLTHHRVVTALPAELPLVPIDALLIEQVLANLLENAAKYAPSGRTITIAAAAVPGALEVRVADEGPGVPADQLAAIFAKFHRVARDGAPTGVGLGLAIAAGIVHAHGGTIRAENQPTGGLAVVFSLPIIGVPPVIRLDDEDADADG